MQISKDMLIGQMIGMDAGLLQPHRRKYLCRP